MEPTPYWMLLVHGEEVTVVNCHTLAYKECVLNACIA